MTSFFVTKTMKGIGIVMDFKAKMITIDEIANKKYQPSARH